MRHRTSARLGTIHSLFAGACACLPGCFAPEVATPTGHGREDDDGEDDDDDDDSDDDGPSACAELDEACSVHGDCCDFAPSTEVGTALCVNDGSQAACTDLCRANGDCGSGCCGQLADEAGYGACMDAAVCDAGYGYGSPDACLRGVEVFCDCGMQLDVPCEDRAGFEASCSEVSEVSAIFTCFAAFDTDQCSAALDACG